MIRRVQLLFNRARHGARARRARARLRAVAARNWATSENTVVTWTYVASGLAIAAGVALTVDDVGPGLVVGGLIFGSTALAYAIKRGGGS